MSWLEEERHKYLDEASFQAPETDARAQLFSGDTGELPLETRRVLAHLLTGPSLDARRHSKLWPALLRDERVIRRRLADLFLELVLDHDLQVAFIRQAEVGELEAPILLRSAPLTFLDSVLLLFLRQRLTQADAQAERAVVGSDEMIEYLGMYERALNTDRSGFTKRCHNSIEKIKKHSILQKLRASEDRYEVAPTLKLLFSAEEIQALTRTYQQLTTGGAGMGTAPDADQEPEA